MITYYLLVNDDIHHTYQRYERLLMTRPAGYVFIASTDQRALAAGCIPKRVVRET